MRMRRRIDEDGGYGILVIGYWISDAGYRIPGSGSGFHDQESSIQHQGLSIKDQESSILIKAQASRIRNHGSRLKAQSSKLTAPSPTIPPSFLNLLMIKIVYPKKKPAIKEEGGKEFVFCIIRKKWMMLTPEEWVRQNTLLYFTESLLYPASLIAVEKKLELGDVQKRFDIVVYKDEKPFVLVECKKMNVPVTQKTLDQVMRYNINLQATCFIVTNGRHCYGFKNDQGHLVELESFPVF
jgi:hypothetical protein